MRDIEIIDRVKALSAAGMTLPTIRQFLPCELDNRGTFEPCFELSSTLRKQTAVVEQKVRKLEVSRAVLSDLLAEMEQ
ncbi:MerR family DNA-binding protein [Nitratireductor rhodophyticola]|uniref:MerR family DNA-binding protein n=1 Tax=Nitratireductor rhodophyticola TaxID=2854036 RepID=UPI0035B56AFF